MKLDHGDMVANILAVRGEATPEQERAGEAWYPTAWGIVQSISEATGTPTHKVAYAISALSPRNPWRWNIADAYAYCVARAEGRTESPRATTFKRNQKAAWAALAPDPTDAYVWLGAAPKVRAFVRAILGDDTSVVVDTWALRVALGRNANLTNRISPKDYERVAAAYREAAGLQGESASTIQAITWLVAQSSGLASRRIGRHDLAFKAGTDQFVIDLLKGV